MATYKYIDEEILIKIEDDGTSHLSCTVHDEDFKAWLSEGNTPEPVDQV